MNADEIQSQVVEKYNELIDHHDELQELRQSGNSFKSDAQLASEQDGVLEGIQAFESVLNEIEEVNNDAE